MCAGVNRRADPCLTHILRKVETVIIYAPSLVR